MKKDRIKLLGNYYKFHDVYSLVKDLSWKVASFEKNFPLPENMTDEDLLALTESYVAFGSKISEITEKWDKTYKEYKDGKDH